MSRRNLYILYGVLAVIAFVVIVLALVLGNADRRVDISANGLIAPGLSPTVSPTFSPSAQPSSVIMGAAWYGGVEFQNVDSYQSKALAWIQGSTSIQRYVLACLYFATNQVSNNYTQAIYGDHTPSWTTQDWMTDAHECEWFGIECDENYLVNGTYLAYSNLTGKLPPELALLSNSLVYLDVSDNVVENSFAELDFLGHLTQLSTLLVGGCFFEDDGLPLFLSLLTNLEVLDVSYALFHGPIAGEIFVPLESLRILEMGGNFYGDEIPMEIATLPNLVRLYAEDALLEGDVGFVGQMPLIFEMWLDSNPGLGGTIPTSIGQVISLESLSLSGCSLDGTIPSELGLLTGMQQMWLYDNLLDGTIPTELSNLQDMFIFHVEANMLNGTMPVGICTNRENLNGYLGADCAVDDDLVECSCCTCCEHPCLA